MSAWNTLLSFTRAHQHELTLSVYIAASPADPSARQSWLVVLRHQLDRIRDELANRSAEEQAVFGRCVGRLFAKLPAQGTMPRDTAWAFFVAAGGAELQLSPPAGVETSASFGLGTQLVPFLRVAEPETALVVQVDRQAARLTPFREGTFGTPVLLEAEGIDEVGPVMSAAPKVGFHSGTRGRAGADEAQRQRREATERLHGTLIRRIGAMADANMPVVIGGMPESAAHVLEALPRALAARAVLAPELRMGAPEQGEALVHAALHTLRARQQHERIHALREMAHANGRAAVGLEVTREAAARGAIAELIFSDRAWRQHPAELEELVHMVLADGADVQWAEPAAVGLMDGPVDGIIAGLRFPIGGASRD
jgi:hypothetical protein